MDPLVIVFGLGVGVLVGLTGIGGGSLMTPLLVIFIGTKPLVAMGLSKWLAMGSVPGSLAGVILVESIDALHNEGLLWGVAFALLLTATATLSRALFVVNLQEV